MLHKRLLFISFLFKPASAIFLFQNISCYYLSILCPVVGLQNIYFKTSHVIVYRCCGPSFLINDFISKHLMLLFIGTAVSTVTKTVIFQNISCYCLSVDIESTETADTIFQNISCYCLSFFISIRYVKSLDFKTSHVIVYLLPAAQEIAEYWDFKTSHVIVYQERSLCHLQIPILFQNISCYCLSSFM